MHGTYGCCAVVDFLFPSWQRLHFQVAATVFFGREELEFHVASRMDAVEDTRLDSLRSETKMQNKHMKY